MQKHLEMQKFLYLACNGFVCVCVQWVFHHLSSLSFGRAKNISLVERFTDKHTHTHIHTVDQIKRDKWRVFGIQTNNPFRPHRLNRLSLGFVVVFSDTLTRNGVAHTLNPFGIFKWNCVASPPVFSQQSYSLQRKKKKSKKERKKEKKWFIPKIALKSIW